MSFTVKTSRPTDAEAISDLLKASYATLMPAAYGKDLLSRALPIMTKANPTLLASGKFFIAESNNGQLVGCGGRSHERPGTGEVVPQLAHIRHFATHPAWAGQGVGRALYEASKRAARQEGVNRFECYASLNAEAFYEAMGFKIVCRSEVLMAPGLMLPHILMEQTISPNGR